MLEKKCEESVLILSLTRLKCIMKETSCRHTNIFAMGPAEFLKKKHCNALYHRSILHTKRILEIRITFLIRYISEATLVSAILDQTYKITPGCITDRFQSSREICCFQNQGRSSEPLVGNKDSRISKWTSMKTKHTERRAYVWGYSAKIKQIRASRNENWV